MPLDREMILFHGMGNPALAHAVATELGTISTPVTEKVHPNGELRVRPDRNMRQKNVFIMQSYPPNRINDCVVETIAAIGAARSASAHEVHLVQFKTPYDRQERKDKSRAAITGAIVAKMFEGAGANSILSLDMHAEALQGAISGPWDNIYAAPVFKPYLERIPRDTLVFGAPDGGSIKRADNFNRIYGIADRSVPIAEKIRRADGTPEVTHLVGDVKGLDIVLVDDVCTSGSTLINAAIAMLEGGARSMRALVTHGELTGNAISNILRSPIQEFFVTDSLPLPSGILDHPDRFKVASVAGIMAEAITCINNGESISEKLIR